MNASNLIRRYWLGSYPFEEGEQSRLADFLEQEEWNIGRPPGDDELRAVYRTLEKIKIVDFFALTEVDRHNLTILAIGIVIDTSEKGSGILKIKWIRKSSLFQGKTLEEQGDDRQFASIRQVENLEDIIRIFGPLFKEEEDEAIRTFTAHSDAFDFWEDEREDIYQDYLEKALE